MQVDLKLYITCFIAAILGMLIQLFSSILKERKRAKAANVIFSYVEYFTENSISMVLNFICMIAAVWLLDFVVGYNPSLIRFIKPFYIAVGFMGSSIWITLLGNYGNKILDVIDVKTNIADGVKQPPKE